MHRGDFWWNFRIMQLRFLRKRNTLSGNYDWRGRYCYKKWGYNLWNCDSVHCIESDPIGSSTDLVAAAAASMAAASVFMSIPMIPAGVAFPVAMIVTGTSRIFDRYQFAVQ